MSTLTKSDRTIQTVFQNRLVNRLVHRSLVVSTAVLVVAVSPALAQTTDPICTASNFPTMLEGFFQFTTSLGIIGLAVVWQADSLMEVFTFDPDRKRRFEQHKRTALKSTVILLVLGPLYTVAGSIMGLPLASCINLTPW